MLLDVGTQTVGEFGGEPGSTVVLIINGIALVAFVVYIFLALVVEAGKK